MRRRLLALLLAVCAATVAGHGAATAAPLEPRAGAWTRIAASAPGDRVLVLRVRTRPCSRSARIVLRAGGRRLLALHAHRRWTRRAVRLSGRGGSVRVRVTRARPGCARPVQIARPRLRPARSPRTPLTSAPAPGPRSVAPPAAPAPAAARAIRLGSAVGSEPLTRLGAPYRDALLANFASLTPENELKWDATEPAPGVFSFAAGDALVDMARAAGMAVRGHTLVWHQQLPGWLTAGARTRDALSAALRRHVEGVVRHYRGRVAQWDVVNEPFEGDGSLRPAPFAATLGRGYIEDALRWAHAADPGARLFINDFATERLNAKSAALYELAADLRRRGVPLHGVGFQMHVSTTWHPTREELERNFARFAALGLAVEVTELDVATSGTPAHRRDAAQADVYRLVAQACRATAACSGITTWGFTDASTWLGTHERPLPFDAALRPKPAWAALRAAGS